MHDNCGGHLELCQMGMSLTENVLYSETNADGIH